MIQLSVSIHHRLNRHFLLLRNSILAVPTSHTQSIHVRPMSINVCFSSRRVENDILHLPTNRARPVGGQSVT